MLLSLGNASALHLPIAISPPSVHKYQLQGHDRLSHHQMWGNYWGDGMEFNVWGVKLGLDERRQTVKESYWVRGVPSFHTLCPKELKLAPRLRNWGRGRSLLRSCWVIQGPRMVAGELGISKVFSRTSSISGIKLRWRRVIVTFLKVPWTSPCLWPAALLGSLLISLASVMDPSTVWQPHKPVI